MVVTDSSGWISSEQCVKMTGYETKNVFVGWEILETRG